MNTKSVIIQEKEIKLKKQIEDILLLLTNELRKTDATYETLPKTGMFAQEQDKRKIAIYKIYTNQILALYSEAYQKGRESVLDEDIMQEEDVWCVVESVNGVSVDCTLFVNQKDAHKYSNSIKEKPADNSWHKHEATVFRKQLKQAVKGGKDA